jgi:hypothetical protein
MPRRKLRRMVKMNVDLFRLIEDWSVQALYYYMNVLFLLLNTKYNLDRNNLQIV